MACCRLLGGWKIAIRHRNGLLQSHWRLILTIALQCTGPTGRLAWFTISKTSRNGSLNHPLAAFPAVNWSKSTFANIYHVGYCRRIKCGNESWQVWGGIVPIKVELSGEICKFQNWGAKCRTRKIAPAPYFLLLWGFGSLTYWLLSGNLVAEMFHGWPRTFFYMTRYYLCAFNGYFELGGTESVYNIPYTLQWAYLESPSWYMWL